MTWTHVVELDESTHVYCVRSKDPADSGVLRAVACDIKAEGQVVAYLDDSDVWRRRDNNETLRYCTRRDCDQRPTKPKGHVITVWGPDRDYPYMHVPWVVSYDLQGKEVGIKPGKFPRTNWSNR